MLYKVEPSGETLGCSIHGMDLGKPFGKPELGFVLQALADYGVVCFPKQSLDPAAQVAFSREFGELEVHVSGVFQEPGYPEVMILSNIIENGKPVGLADAGQDWHTDMSYSATIAFANMLYALKVPHRDGSPLGGTEFANMRAAYTDLPAGMKARLDGMTVLHDFNKFWDMMRQRPGSWRKPMSPEQRAQKPPVSHPIFLDHPITGERILYCNPGYAIRINELPEQESAETLDYLFAHQLQPKYRYLYRWTEGDVLFWDDLGTLHNAQADYGPDEPRLIKRCQVMADRIFEPGFVQGALAAA
jgi:taurine dioxygenase